MEAVVKDKHEMNRFNVLLIGNNPIELSSIYERLMRLKDKKFIAETAFDLKSALKSRMKFKPSFILIDDNLGRTQLNQIVQALSSQKDTENIPITILKNSNSGYSVQEAQEYILKNNADGESIAKALFNSERLKKTQEFIKKTYSNNKKKFKRAINSL